MHITSKGQVTIPQFIREKMGLLPNTEVEFSIVGNQVVIEKMKTSHTRGQSLIEKMRGKSTVNMSTDDIMALTRGDHAKRSD